jgi:hypothetical protein
MLYADIQNILNFKAEQPALLILQTDETGVPLIDPEDSSRYLLKFVQSDIGTILPTVGIIIEI